MSKIKFPEFNEKESYLHIFEFVDGILTIWTEYWTNEEYNKNNKYVKTLPLKRRLEIYNENDNRQHFYHATFNEKDRTYMNYIEFKKLKAKQMASDHSEELKQIISLLKYSNGEITKINFKLVKIQNELNII